MDTGRPWTCGTCDAPNAGYRRRCQDCGAKRPAEPVEPVEPPSTEPAGKVDLGDIPMPLLARRRQRSGRRWPGLAGAAVVLALATYGAVAYVGADGRSVDADIDAVRSALLRADEVPGASGEDPQLVVDGDDRALLGATYDTARCDDDDLATLAADEAGVLDDAAGVVIQHVVPLAEGGGVMTRVVVFDTPPAAEAYDDLVRGDEAAACGVALEDARVAVVGRAWVLVGFGGWFAYAPGTEPVLPDVAELEALLDLVAERLELEG